MERKFVVCIEELRNELAVMTGLILASASAATSLDRVLSSSKAVNNLAQAELRTYSPK